MHGCAAAAAAGIRPGMPLTQARALLPGHALEIVPHAPHRDRSMLHRLALVASRRLSPTVAIDDSHPALEPAGLLIDATGCAHLFGGEPRYLKAARAMLARIGFRARCAIAPTIGCAWAIAHASDDDAPCIDAHEVHDALAPLPTSALRINDDTAAALAETGIRRIGELLQLPRQALAARFGQALLLRLDQAMGRAIETLDPVRPAPPPTHERLFAGPTDRIDAIECTVQDLLCEAMATLRARGLGPRALTIELLRSDLEPASFTLTLSRPSLDPRHLWSLARPRLERLSLGFGVEGVRIHARSLTRLAHQQTTHIDGPAASADNETSNALSALCDTLTNRLGHGRVLRPRLLESHLPERAADLRPADRDPCTPDAALIPHRDRPTALFSIPEPVEVVALTPDGPVHRVHWRGADHPIIRCKGPERMSHEWWRDTTSTTRDYFAVQTDTGQWLWLCRSIEQGRWYLHGVWA